MPVACLWLSQWPTETWSLALFGLPSGACPSGLVLDWFSVLAAHGLLDLGPLGLAPGEPLWDEGEGASGSPRSGLERSGLDASGGVLFGALPVGLSFGACLWAWLLKSDLLREGVSVHPGEPRLFSRERAAAQGLGLGLFGTGRGLGVHLTLFFRSRLDLVWLVLRLCLGVVLRGRDERSRERGCWLG